MENKRAYIKPILESETFIPQNYIAACGDINKVYLFTCDAGWTALTGSTVYTNGADGIPETKDDVELGSYGKCGATHEASTTDDFIPGYLKKNVLGIPAGPRQDVIIWRGEDGNNIHCTKNLDMDSWTTIKS
ncbi:hypothetical protein [Phocaeicola coprocola]|uniref:hypothetical protein n=1 Tax=Phocaeicola coprocola TaxID=310298 RepID=UPI001C3839ED|nr:hypothetical protein [Phocaeicola coprocola]MBV3866015.1 hypothetical protein [Phocaeicola coprocola]MBV4007195.1 hypothetical protein [Phocaeicola coprocola]MBV4031716.1 hypothetical protein [Phocaeicola coprocola]MBV4038208.1 hypothetical protein [Phocaeicola coprocola]MBV4059938.1 hypothetical protein [Phocaeicola coprocola]